MANLSIAVIGAGPVGLSLALHASRALPDASISLFDTREAGVDIARDPRTLALSLGSIQLLQRLKAWSPENAQPITAVHVSQQGPNLLGNALSGALADPSVRIDAASQRVPQLGAVLSYGQIVAPLELVWHDAVAREPDRLHSRFGTPVRELVNLPMPGVRAGGARGVRLRLARADGSDAELLDFDLAVVAEGGVFADQSRKALRHDYRQTAWVGHVVLAGPQRGIAYERFTRYGPAALLPLPDQREPASLPALQLSAATHRAALVWCVPSDEDPVRDLTDAQRLAVLGTIFHADTGKLVSIGPLKQFPLGLNAERTLCRGRVVRIGNAAQTLHPVAGQGLNLGLRDAFELVQRLSRRAPAPVTAPPHASPTASDAASLAASDARSLAIDEALRRVEWSRAPDRWAMIAATDFLARSFTWNLPGFSTVRSLGLAGLQAAGPLKSFVARQMMFGRR